MEVSLHPFFTCSLQHNANNTKLNGTKLTQKRAVGIGDGNSASRNQTRLFVSWYCISHNHRHTFPLGLGMPSTCLCLLSSRGGSVGNVTRLRPRSVFLNRRAAARYRALASIIPGREKPEETTICYQISLVQLISNLNVILYL